MRQSPEPRPALRATTCASSHDLRFAEQQNQAFLLIALAMLLVSAGLALPLARHFVRPIRSLTRATRQLASGDYSPRIVHRADDELGQLARDFNDLAHTLGRNEALRHQWVADISHELRTPLAILRGEIEAVQDGVRSLDAGVVESLHQEVLHLTRLVDRIYPDNRIVSERTIDSHVKKLRRKLEALLPGRELIHSVYGMGYKYEPDA